MRIPGPLEMVRLAASVPAALQTAVAAAFQLAELTRQLAELVHQAREFVVDATLTQRQAQALVELVGSTRLDAQAIADRVGGTQAEAAAAVSEASAAVAEAAALIESVQQLLTRFQPALAKLGPLTEVVAREVTTDDAQALTDMLHTAPDLVDTLQNDVVPVLDSLDTVGPDLRDVREVTHAVDEMLGAVPGLGRVKKRVEREQVRKPRPPAAVPETATGEPTPL